MIGDVAKDLAVQKGRSAGFTQTDTFRWVEFLCKTMRLEGVVEISITCIDHAFLLDSHIPYVALNLNPSSLLPWLLGAEHAGIQCLWTTRKRRWLSAATSVHAVGNVDRRCTAFVSFCKFLDGGEHPQLLVFSHHLILNPCLVEPFLINEIIR